MAARLSTETLHKLVKAAKAEVIVRNTDVAAWQEEVTIATKIQYEEESLLRLADITWKLENRENFKNFLVGLLVVQNMAVFGLVTYSLIHNKIQGLETLFSVLVAGTLLETTSMVYLIVKWLFSEIPYDKKMLQELRKEKT